MKFSGNISVATTLKNNIKIGVNKNAFGSMFGRAVKVLKVKIFMEQSYHIKTISNTRNLVIFIIYNNEHSTFRVYNFAVYVKSRIVI